MSSSVLGRVEGEMTNALAFEDVTKEYDGRRANDGLSFWVKPGEIFGLLGPNGSGKSTAVGLITGLIAPNGGKVRVLGNDPIADFKQVRRSIGLVSQETVLYEDLTGRQNLEFAAALFLPNIRHSRTRIDEILEFVELKNRQHDRVKTYSGGMKRRLAIGRALLHDPEFIILDEPTLGVDVQGTHRIWDYVKDVASRGKSVLVTTNVMNEADYLCDRLLIIDEGKEIAIGSPAELKATLGTEEILIRKQPSLDDVFLNLTGRGLRDAS
jgi:ABC-2 type transport system ATP-binding protein